MTLKGVRHTVDIPFVELETGTKSVPIRAALLGAAFIAIGVVGYVDGKTSAYIAFSIFYIVPIFLIAWFGGRTLVSVAAVASGICGLLADLWTIQAGAAYASVNLVLRIALFLVVGQAFVSMREAIESQRRVAERERELAEERQKVIDLRRQIAERVVMDAREPLAEIYAKVVDLNFDRGELSADEARRLLSDLAAASLRVSQLIASLEGKTRDDAVVP